MGENLNVVLVGNMARDHALAARLEGCQVNAIGQSDNPGLIEVTESTGGRFFKTTDITNGEVVAAFAEDVFDGHKGPKLLYVGADDPLDKGVIDIVQRHLPGVLTVGPNAAASKLESDKFVAREIIDEIDRENGTNYNPKWFPVTNEAELEEALDFFRTENQQVVDKPRNLTGGKGVRVMSEHLKTYEGVRRYAKEILADPKQTGLSMEEEIKGYEYTIQAWTDGLTLITPPVTYDFPYRLDGDKGPGTGGMADFTMNDGLMPFLTQDDYDESIWLMQQVQQKWLDRGHVMNGVLYGSFFKELDGEKKITGIKKATEFNGRGGDPELVNILELMEDEVDMSQALINIAIGELKSDDIRYKKLASTLIYLVAPDYAYPDTGKNTYKFQMNLPRIAGTGVKAYFAGAQQIPGERGNWTNYRVGSSRAVALVALADTPWEARGMILEAKAASVEGPLRLRLDPGSKAYIDAMPRAA